MPLMPPAEFWKLVHSYDGAIFPAQFAFAGVAVTLVGLVAARPGPAASRAVSLFLAACYGWVGGAFFLVHNRELSAQMRYFQPVLMFLIAALFLGDVFLGRARFRLPRAPGHRAVVLFFVAYSLIGYPVVGWLLGHPYEVRVSEGFVAWVPLLGTYPCPTTVFSLALLGAALPHGNRPAMVPLLFWALFSLGGPPVKHYGCYEDLALFAAGIYGLNMLIVHHRRRDRPTEEDRPDRSTFGAKETP